MFETIDSCSNRIKGCLFILTTLIFSLSIVAAMGFSITFVMGIFLFFFHEAFSVNIREDVIFCILIQIPNIEISLLVCYLAKEYLKKYD